MAYLLLSLEENFEESDICLFDLISNRQVLKTLKNHLQNHTFDNSATSPNSINRNDSFGDVKNGSTTTNSQDDLHVAAEEDIVENKGYIVFSGKVVSKINLNS